MLIARKQVLVQLSDELLERLDAAAARSDRSRSAVIRDAIDHYLKPQWDPEVARMYREAYTRMPLTEEELAWSDAAASETLRRLEKAEDEPW